MASNIVKVMMYGEMQIIDLQVHFNRFGRITEIKQPYFEADSKHSYDYETYIIFETKAAADEACCDKSNQLVEGFRVDVCLHKGPVPQPVIGMRTFSPSPSVSLPNTVKISIIAGQPTSNKLSCIFRQYGELFPRPISILGKAQTYAYINYKDPQDAKRAAIGVHNKSLPNGLLLYARLFKKRPSSRQSSAVPAPIQFAPPQNARLSETTAPECQWPSTWELSGQFRNTPNVLLFEVQNGVPEWNDVSSLFCKTMPEAKLVSIKRIQNKRLYVEYQHRITMMLADKKPLNEKKLFHGSRSTLPETIYSSKEGFDFRHCEDGGLLGRGTYFAEKASLSNSYCFRNATGHRQILLATVLTGETKWIDKHNPSLGLPPAHPDPSKTYDSVSAYHPDGSVMFVMYNLYVAYPTHLITYDTA